jgi:hypothetical protein
MSLHPIAHKAEVSVDFPDKALRNGSSGSAAHDMAIGAPLLRELRALLGVGQDGVRGNQGKHQ